MLVGDSAKARKGSSWDHVERTFGRADSSFAARVRTGLSTGEGLIWAARDPNGADPGAADAPLLVVEPEFVTVLKATGLKATGRDINTLSPVLRAAWDGRPLALLTRTAPVRASAAHVAVVGHITATELAHHTSAVEAANGFLNRFCFIACRRHRLLPEGGDPEPLAGTGMEARLAAHLGAARRAGRVQLDPAARGRWQRRLRPALAGRRGDRRLPVRPSRSPCAAPGHALCPRRRRQRHPPRPPASRPRPVGLRGPLSGLGDPGCHRRSRGRADPRRPCRQPRGLTRTQLRDLFGRNLPRARIDAALTTLGHTGRAQCHRATTSGRPAEVWVRAAPDAAHHH